METVVNVIFLLALYWAAWKILYLATASLPGCTERVFMVFYREVRERRVSYNGALLKTSGSMSMFKLAAFQAEVGRRRGGTAAVTGFHLLEERNIFPRRAVAVLYRACLWLVSKVLCPILRRVLRPLRKAWAWVSVMWTRTEDHVVAEYEAERERERSMARMVPPTCSWFTVPDRTA